MQHPNILCVGTIPPPYHGQAIAFEAACSHMAGMKYIVNQNFEGKHALLKSLLLGVSFLKIWYFLLFKKLFPDIFENMVKTTKIGTIIVDESYPGRANEILHWLKKKLITERTLDGDSKKQLPLF